MEPTELRRAAERCRDNSVAQNAAVRRGCSPHEWEWSQEQQEEMARYCLEASHCVDHILSTVREDDGEAVTEEWLRSLPHTQGKYPDDIIIGPVVRMIVRNAQSPSNSRWDWCVGSYQIPEEHKPRTRGQLRRLLEGLGIA